MQVERKRRNGRLLSPPVTSRLSFSPGLQRDTHDAPLIVRWSQAPVLRVPLGKIYAILLRARWCREERKERGACELTWDDHQHGGCVEVDSLIMFQPCQKRGMR